MLVSAAVLYIYNTYASSIDKAYNIGLCCMICEGVYSNLVCFKKGLDADGALLFRDLCNEVATKTNEWKAIALQLHITMNDVNRIAIESGGTVEECFRRVFDKWRRAVYPPFTWDTIITALQTEAVSEHRLAQQLQEKHPLQ